MRHPAPKVGWGLGGASRWPAKSWCPDRKSRPWHPEPWIRVSYRPRDIVSPSQQPVHPAPCDTSAPGGVPELLQAMVDRRDPGSQAGKPRPQEGRGPPAVRLLAFAQTGLPCRPLLTPSLLSQSLSWDCIHGCHQGAGPALAGDDPAGAETVLVRGPSPEARVAEQRGLRGSSLLL